MRRSDDDSPSGLPRFRVAFVCTGNRARSPFAAALLRRHVARLSVTVESFGTLEPGGAPALPNALQAARSFGIDLAPHRSRPLLRGELAGSDLVIGFEPFHVASAVVDGGASRRNAFLLTELADLLHEVRCSERSDGCDAQTLVALADARRGASLGSPPAIADPVGRSARRFLSTFDEIDRAVATVAVELFSAEVRSPE